MARQCGDCTLCCKLLPMQAVAAQRAPNVRAAMRSHGCEPEFDKPAGARCPHQRHAKGCVIYNRRPVSCRLWNCRWLAENDTADLSRPDRSHYCIDIMPDYITCEEGGQSAKIEVVQVWVDPDFRDAHRDAGLRAYLARRGEEGIAGLIRFSNSDGFLIIPPAMTSDGRWIEKDFTEMQVERSTIDRIVGVAEAVKGVSFK